LLDEFVGRDRQQALLEGVFEEGDVGAPLFVSLLNKL